VIAPLGGFENVAAEWTPRVYFIRNTAGLTSTGAYVMNTQFTCTEELGQPVYFRDEDWKSDSLPRLDPLLQLPAGN
jgi:hypothetical protein